MILSSNSSKYCLEARQAEATLRNTLLLSKWRPVPLGYGVISSGSCLRRSILDVLNHQGQDYKTGALLDLAWVFLENSITQETGVPRSQQLLRSPRSKVAVPAAVPAVKH